uniref:Uncharacterized protein n=1 Tax=Chrysotila carterae TaxID=13221 RepID=A0A7S4BSU0_CHRCT|mmetsp:Transcript_22088/g.46659  ORF Transcript_22088/g.46659 Transcript_22088/m.46659 type:complete len:259 (-) Transcript_22088:288-1064(-)
MTRPVRSTTQTSNQAGYQCGTLPLSSAHSTHRSQASARTAQIASSEASQAKNPQSSAQAAPIGRLGQYVPPVSMTGPLVSSTKLQQLKDLAAKLGFVVQPVQSFKRLFVKSVTNRLKMREGSFVYQSAAYHLPNFPREAATSLFPLHRLTEQSPKGLTWSLSTTRKISEFMREMLTSPPTSTAGTSRALLKPSERHLRVLATLMPPLEVSWVQMEKAQQRLYVNMLYALCDKAGELHLPKDNARQELALVKTGAPVRR